MSDDHTTYDGLPIAPDKPFVACIVVYREGPSGLQLLMLHRAENGPDYEGDWAWTPPAGARFPGEDVLVGAARELLEETGLTLPLRAAPCIIEECAVFLARAEPHHVVQLHEEHDRFEWLSEAEALARCAPAVVCAEIEAALRLLRA